MLRRELLLDIATFIKPIGDATRKFNSNYLVDKVDCFAELNNYCYLS